MTDEQSEVNVEISGTTVTVGAKGSGADRLTHVVADALSPFSEGLGYIGDVVRFYRQDTALRSIARAVELAESLDIKMRPVPPKFLVDWVEKASLESPDEPEMTDLWAGLLVSASRAPSPTHYVFKRILSEMTREHVTFLSDFCDIDILKGDTFKPATDFSIWQKLVNDRDASLTAADTESGLYTALSEIENNRLKIRHYEIAEYSKFMIDKKVIDTKIRMSIDEYRKNYIVKFFIDNGVMSESSMIAKLDCPEFHPKRPTISITALHLTQFGVLFLQTCRPSKETPDEV
ncbi:MAG: hypothetical protein QE484_09720 [Rhizobium sp.]|nr:hypothetical protein [Rhizobium sp.]